MEDKKRLVQISHPGKGRLVALVTEPFITPLRDITSVYHLALQSLDSGRSIHTIIEDSLSTERIAYDAVYHGTSEWKLLPSFDNPDAVAGCIVSGTGLTHNSGALNRQMMHQGEMPNTHTDSMKIYLWGLDGGKPEDGKIGTQPEWFYKGTGAILRGHRDELTVPNYGNDGGEEPEVAGVYIIDRKSEPVRIGLTTGNEFSDHVMEKKNYLYLAPSKLRTCSIGPELVLTDDFTDLKGRVRVARNHTELWSAEIHTGEKNMAHSLTNLEYHHFKYHDHRQPLQAHVHFFGTGAFSFGAGIRLETGDEMQVQWEGMGRPLVNTIKIESDERFIRVKAL